MSKIFEEFQEYLKKVNEYSHVVTLLYWDMKTGMPKGGLEGHVNALTRFSTEEFKMSTSPELFEMLNKLAQPEEFEQLDDMWKFVVKEMKEDIEKDQRIPADFFEEYTRVQAESSAAWEEAKNASDFSIYAPHLEKMIEMTKQMTKYREPEKDVYDALINQFEKGMDCETIDKVFGELKEELIPLVKQILAAEQPDDSKFNAYFDPDAQKKVQKLLLEYMGFTFERGSVGESEHPFTLNFSSKDVRVTNHYHENNALISMYSAIHEGGHAIFEQNVNPDFDGTIAGSCRYMGIHESQSRFYENILGRNKNFWVPIYAKIQELLPAYKEITLDEFYHEINHVRNSFIRTDADEITYAFHIILRYEIEKEIFRNNVSVDQLPKLWNQKMEEYLGITHANDAEGILQDMHWSDGSFGYFPSYLLGSVYDGMFYEKMQEELGDVDEILAKGNIKDITKWLNEKIHQYGSTRAPKEVIEKVCGVEVSAKPLIRHFKKKYIEIYNL